MFMYVLILDLLLVTIFYINGWNEPNKQGINPKKIWGQILLITFC